MGPVGVGRLAAIVKGGPDWSLLPNDTTVLWSSTLRKCLARKREQRALLNASDAVSVENEMTVAAVPIHLKVVTDWFSRLKSLAPQENR